MTFHGDAVAGPVLVLYDDAVPLAGYATNTDHPDPYLDHQFNLVHKTKPRLTLAAPSERDRDEWFHACSRAFHHYHDLITKLRIATSKKKTLDPDAIGSLAKSLFADPLKEKQP